MSTDAQRAQRCHQSLLFFLDRGAYQLRLGRPFGTILQRFRCTLLRAALRGRYFRKGGLMVVIRMGGNKMNLQCERFHPI